MAVGPDLGAAADLAPSRVAAASSPPSVRRRRLVPGQEGVRIEVRRGWVPEVLQAGTWRGSAAERGGSAAEVRSRPEE